MRTIAMSLALVASLTVACKKEEAAPSAANKPVATEPTKPAEPPKAAEPAPAEPASAPAAARESLGVPECDDYIKKADACYVKLTGPEIAGKKAALDQTIAAWKEAIASGGAAKASVADLCKGTLEAAKSLHTTCEF